MTASLNSPKQGSTLSKDIVTGPKLTSLSHNRTGQKWTIGARYKHSDEITLANAPTPGPGAYSPLQPNPNATKYSPPKFSITPRREVKENSIVVPGPGAYMGPGDGKLKTQISISLQSRHFPKDYRGGLPGPGAYTPENPNFVSPRWTLGSKYQLDRAENFPGPSEYTPEKPKVTRATFLHPRVKDRPNTSFFNPGPGAYDINSEDTVRPKAPSYSLGPRTTYMPHSATGSPGPGAYDNHVTFTHAKAQSPKYSITPRREAIENNATPGPGAYSPSSPGFASAPKSGIGLGDRFPMKVQSSAPGPGQYDPKIDFYSVKEGKPAFSLTSRRHTKSASSSFPGPGQYTPKSDAIKPASPRHSLHSRFNIPGGNLDTPGPDHYHVHRPSSSPAFTLKSRTHVSKGLLTPSPAAYRIGSMDATIKPRSPAYSLGARTEYKGGNNQTPGPGAYDAPFTF